MNTAIGQMRRVQVTEAKMGSPFTISLFAADTFQAKSQIVKMLAYTDSLIKIFSDYDTASELSRLGRYPVSQPVSVSAPMMDLLQISRRAWRLSGGRFDVTIGRITLLWRQAMQQDQWPDPQSLSKAKRHAGFRHLKLLPDRQAVIFNRSGMMLNMGGIAKGYIAQKVLDSLRALGFSQAMVDAGGDIVAGNPPPGKPGWRIGIAVPESFEQVTDSMLWVNHAAIATSGQTYRYLEHNGRQYSHIVDPKSGLGVTHHRQVTVLASEGAMADWMATACSILRIRKARALARKLGVKLWIAEAKQDGVHWIVEPSGRK